ncbi:hypothetical protein JHK87_025756 [Glycine soja]|nr:hypothetical protein JHK87_025756 [Glycine soja]
MTRGKQKIEAQKRNAERNQKGKGSQLEARAVGLKVICPICKVGTCHMVLKNFAIAVCKSELSSSSLVAQLANQNQLVDHYASKHPKEKPPAETS